MKKGKGLIAYIKDNKSPAIKYGSDKKLTPKQKKEQEQRLAEAQEMIMPQIVIRFFKERNKK